MTMLAEHPMAKESKERKDSPVRIDNEVLTEVRIAAAFLEMGVAEFINETLRPAAEKVVREHSAKRAAAQAAKKLPKA